MPAKVRNPWRVQEISNATADFDMSEFYRTTQYGRDYVIGKNCRFLQGPKTDRACIDRMKAAIKSGQEVFETVLN